MVNKMHESIIVVKHTISTSHRTIVNQPCLMAATGPGVAPGDIETSPGGSLRVDMGVTLSIPASSSRQEPHQETPGEADLSISRDVDRVDARTSIRCRVIRPLPFLDRIRKR